MSVTPEKILEQDWSQYVGRPLTLFLASVWYTWYHSKEGTDMVGVKTKQALYIQEEDGLIHLFQPKKVQDDYKDGYARIIREQPELALEIVKKGVKLNEEVKSVLKEEITPKNFSDRLLFLQDLTWYAAVFPAFFIQEAELQGIKRPEVEAISHELRTQSLYPQIMDQISEYVLSQLVEWGVSDPERGQELVTLNEFLNKDIQVIEERLKQETTPFALYYEDDIETVLWGNEAKQIADALFEVDEEEEISGQVAFKGKVTGIARVVRDFARQKDIEFNEGDILVSVNSNPDMMHWIRKSAALVTDEGGIICHAAIVSRELEIPCVIGTKFATKRIKDGDLIEVDAEKGVIIILEQ